LIFIFGDADETIFAEDDGTCVVLWRIFILLEHNTRVLILDLFQRKEYLASLLNLSEQICHLFSSLGLLLRDISVS